MSGVVDQLSTFFARHGDDVVAAYLFGSCARGTAAVASDVDVAVLLATDPPRTLDGLRLGLVGELEDLLSRRVDLVVLNRAPVDLVHRVLRDGVVVADRDRAARLRFEVKARAAYLDLLPFLRRYRQRETAA